MKKTAKKLTLSITAGLLLSSLLLPSAFAADTPTGTVTSGGLTWTFASKKANWSNANSICGKLTTEGYTDWRLPTKAQLSTLQATSKVQLINAGWPLVYTWSATTAGAGYHYIVGLNSGLVYSYADSTYYSVSCVH